MGAKRRAAHDGLTLRRVMRGQHERVWQNQG
jgi:hypothetical protein